MREKGRVSMSQLTVSMPVVMVVVPAVVVVFPVVMMIVIVVVIVRHLVFELTHESGCAARESPFQSTPPQLRAPCCAAK